jgi:hypothetical protein
MYTSVIIAIILILFGLIYILLLAYGRISDKGAEIVTKFFGEARGSTGLILVILGVILLIVMSLLIEEPVGIPDFNISVNPMEGEVQQGGVIPTTVSVVGIQEYDHTVRLSASGQPSGIVISFVSPFREAKPFYTSRVTIYVSQNVLAGNYKIFIKGTGADGKEHSCIYTLTVKPSVTPTVTPTSIATHPPTTPCIIATMDSTSGWRTYKDNEGSSINIKSIPGKTDNAIEISYDLKEWGWVTLNKRIDPSILSEIEGIRFFYKGTGKPNTIEFKLMYSDGDEYNGVDTTFGFLINAATVKDDWTQVEVPYDMLECWWSDKSCDDNPRPDLNKVRKIEFAISNKPEDGDASGSGKVIIDDVQGITP